VRTWPLRALRAGLALWVPGALACGSQQEVARLGDLQLRAGGIIRECFVSYRTAGRLNADKSNVVVVLPWYQGNSDHLAAQVGPGKLVDTSKYFVVMFDSLGNGASSSPSNSASQPGAAFPVFAMEDVVASQYQVLTQTLRLTHVHAIIGVSMGGMQVFQWLISHPDFMTKAVSIVGSPQTQPNERQGWQEGIAILERESTWTRVRKALMKVRPRTAVNEFRLHPYNVIRQAQAIMSFDITRNFGGSFERTAAALKAEVFVVGTLADREVDSRPAFELARFARAELLELDGRCGHQAPSCERAVLWPAVARFLAR
jgi:homoserine O-acetyltransferase/O-succinyltransferase